MSGLGEAFLALKNVMLLHERVERLQKEIEGLAGNQKDMNRAVTDIDKRLARLEGFIEGASAVRPAPPRIEG
ncbi:hypothetical protein BH10PSE12_BH10PSE12_21610 [soil metagenome]